MKLHLSLVAFLLTVAIAIILPFSGEARAMRAVRQYALKVRNSVLRATEEGKRAMWARRRGHIAGLRNNREREPHLQHHHLAPEALEAAEHQDFLKKLQKWWAKTNRPSN